MKTLLKTLAIFCLGAFALVGCEKAGEQEKVNDGIPMGFVLVADKTAIYDNGKDYATLTAYYDRVALEEGDYALFLGNTPFDGNKFSSTETNKSFVFSALREGTEWSNKVTINVIKTPPPAPAAPEDTNPGKTNFKRRVLLTQFTATGCGYCPLMMNAIHSVATSSLGDDIVVTAAHLGGGTYLDTNDPVRLLDALTLDDALGVTNGIPQIVADFDQTTQHPEQSILRHDAWVKRITESSLNRVDVKGGIAVNSAYYADYSGDSYIVINATVKAKKTADFRIGAWLLEDGIDGEQSVYEDPYTNTGELIQPIEGVNFNKHNNCIRIANSKRANLDFSGISLGTISAGNTKSKDFIFKLKPNGTGALTTWNHDNLRVIVFITTKEDGKWLVNNVVKCPKDGSVDFEYEN